MKRTVPTVVCQACDASVEITYYTKLVICFRELNMLKCGIMPSIVEAASEESVALKRSGRWLRRIGWLLKSAPQ